LNLFGRPRVTFWPVNTNVEQRTGFDDLFAFTSTLYKDPSGNRDNDNTFYFTRYDGKDNENDYKSTPPNNPANKNPKIMDYLRLMTGSGPFPTIPGFGGCFLNKYTEAEREQILQMIFDYCRSVNLVDTSQRQRAGVAFHPYTPFFGQGSGYDSAVQRSNNWSAQVTPIRINTTNYQGLGRFPTVQEVALVFYRQTANSLRAALLLEMTTPMAGYPAIRETFWTRVTVDRPTVISVKGATPAVDEKDINLVGAPGTSRINICSLSSHDVGNGRSYTPSLGFINQLYYNAEASGWTDIDDPARPKQTGALGQKKTFTNSDPASVNYQRFKTAYIYPYVSDIITRSQPLTLS
jgi:hypothetical protein